MQQLISHGVSNIRINLIRVFSRESDKQQSIELDAIQTIGQFESSQSESSTIPSKFGKYHIQKSNGTLYFALTSNDYAEADIQELFSVV